MKWDKEGEKSFFWVTKMFLQVGTMVGASENDKSGYSLMKSFFERFFGTKKIGKTFKNLIFEFLISKTTQKILNKFYL